MDAEINSSSHLNKKKRVRSKTEKQKKMNNDLTLTDYKLQEDFPYLDLRGLIITDIRKTRPLLLSPNLTIIVEKFSRIYRIAFEFLMSISEPINRSNYIHEYRITQMSLYTGMVLQYSSEDIINVLELLSKNHPPIQMQNYIRKHTQNMGLAKFYLKEGYYWLDLGDDVADMVFKEMESIIAILKRTGKSTLSIEDILIEGSYQEQQSETKTYLIEENPELKAMQTNITSQLECEEKINQEQLNRLVSEVEHIQNTDQTQGLQIQQNKFKRYKIIGDYFIITESLINTYVPLIQEFDITQNQNILDIHLKGTIKPRIYQQRALKNFIIKDKARSGLVVLPCGAGKTMVGIMCVDQLKCSSIIICDSNVSVDQWKREFERCTTIQPKKIVRITGYVKDKWLGEMPVVLLTTYSWLIAQMVPSRLESQVNQALNAWQLIQQKEWGLCIVDEVHRLPALQFCNVLRSIRCAVKMGLTATLLREDSKLDNLYYMIGPKLYEENLIDLMSQGYLARPYIVEILCPMSDIFKQEYDTRQSQIRTLLHTGNPKKFAALQFLIKQHERLGHKIIVFCDSLLILNYYANMLGYPVIDGDLNTDEKNKVFNLFKTSNEIKTIFVSRVGDTGIDIPQASVGIEIGYLGGSRRQKVQRLGRVMRPKLDQDQDISAFFYSLASKDTVESEYSYKRQKYITEQLGLNTELINESDLPYNQNLQKFGIKPLNEMELLEQILLSAKDFRKQQSKIQEDDEQEQIQVSTVQRSYTDTIGGIYKFT